MQYGKDYTLDDLVQVSQPSNPWMTAYRGQIVSASDVAQGKTRSHDQSGTPYVYDQSGSVVDPSFARDHDLVHINGLEMTVGQAIELGFINDRA